MGRAFICPDGQLHRPATSRKEAACGLQFAEGSRRRRAGEEPGQIARLFVEMDRREDQFDGPFGGQPFGLQRIGEAKAADGEVRAARRGSGRAAGRRPGLRRWRAFGQQVEIRADQPFVDEGRADLDRRPCRIRGSGSGPAGFQAGCRGRRRSTCRAALARLRQRLAGAGARSGGDAVEGFLIDAEGIRDRAQPGRCALFAERERAPRYGARRGVPARAWVSPRKGWVSSEDGVGADGRGSSARWRGQQDADRADAHLREQATN